MRQNYFIYNGQYYKAGAIIIVHQLDYIAACNRETEATFLYYDTKSNRIAIQIKRCTHYYTIEMFKNIFVRATDKTNMTLVDQEDTRFAMQNREKTFQDELNINGLLIAWIWYIFIMAISIIFKDCIGIWVLASFVFFNYRNRKLKEAGHK